MAKSLDVKNFRKQITKELDKKMRVKLNAITRSAAKEVMNGLAEAGPVWSGEFRDSWKAKLLGSNAIGATGGYPYSLKNIPKIPLTVKQLKRTYQIQIFNTAPHALIAMDKEPGNFVYPGFEPLKPIHARGIRNVTGLRGDIEAGTGNNRSTAPLDWYENYKKGGQFKRRVNKGVALARILGKG
tara:strand:- start:83 stop:634 length:552 start_codon:yes stop_codon:yes gene_type:complete